MTTKERYEAASPVRLDDLHPGDIVIVDAGFSCIPPWATRVVKLTTKGKLFIDCGRGALHYLEGQCDEEGAVLIGVRKLP